MSNPTYWLPSWWGWTDCMACLKYNKTMCTSCEIPPGLLAMACLVGGGVATVAGSKRGNIAVGSARQAAAANRMPGPNVRTGGQSFSVTDVNVSVESNLESHEAVDKMNQRGFDSSVNQSR